MTESSHLSRVRATYDVVAASYDELLRDELVTRPFDRAMLGVFAELVNGPVADVGCGPGRITAALAASGVDVFGIDLSPHMIEIARSRHPAIRFVVGDLSELDLAGGSVDGVVAWYSIIHTPPDRLPGVFEEFGRVLRAGGHALLAFKAGDQVRHLAAGYGHDGLDLDIYWLDPDDIASLATSAGFIEVARLTRAADADEAGPQAYLLVRKPVDS